MDNSRAGAHRCAPPSRPGPCPGRDSCPWEGGDRRSVGGRGGAQTTGCIESNVVSAGLACRFRRFRRRGRRGRRGRGSAARGFGTGVPAPRATVVEGLDLRIPTPGEEVPPSPGRRPRAPLYPWPPRRWDRSSGSPTLAASPPGGESHATRRTWGFSWRTPGREPGNEMHSCNGGRAARRDRDPEGSGPGFRAGRGHDGASGGAGVRTRPRSDPPRPHAPHWTRESPHPRTSAEKCAPTRPTGLGPRSSGPPGASESGPARLRPRGPVTGSCPAAP
mgnify:CR=1 FL=1